MILKSLSRQPMHGYALAMWLKDISEGYLLIEEGSLYTALQRMLRNGWLETEMGLSARNRPVRVFKVTAAGKKRLERELASVEMMFTGFNRAYLHWQDSRRLDGLAHTSVLSPPSV